MMHLESILIIVVFVESFHCFKRVCYLTIDHRPFGNHVLQGFEGDFCTHINVLPVSLDGEGNVFPNSPLDINKYRKVQELKMINPELKILATLITYSGAEVFTKATRDAETRKRFAQNILDFLKQYNFDGVDIDWEFPVYSTQTLGDRENFISLLHEIRHLIDTEASGKLLSVAVAADITIVALGYDAVGLNSTVDYINLMSYDYTDWHWYFPFTGHNAPFASSGTGWYFKKLNMQFSARYWNSLGVAKSKIMVGIPTYSHSFYLRSPHLHFPGAPAVSEGPEFSYSEVCRFLKQKGSVRVFDKAASVPYAYNESMWITYEDEESAAKKAQWIRDHEFGGSMTYNLNNDDMDGSCSSNSQPFALHRLIRSLLPD